MQRIKAVELVSGHPLFETLKAIESQTGFMFNDGLLMAHTPEIATAFAQLSKSILFSGTIEPGMKRLIGLIVSLSSGCQYCMSHTAYSADKLQVAQSKIEAVWDYESSDEFSPKEKAMLRLASKASMHPNAAEERDVDALKIYLSDAEVVELVSLISFYGFLNRFNQTLATEMESKPKAILQSLNTIEND